MAINEYLIALRNVVVGSNLYSLYMAAAPRKMVSYASECMFLAKQLHPNGDLPQMNVWEYFKYYEPLPVRLEPDGHALSRAGMRSRAI